ncbi:T9SS type A sorting domain-containing protein [Flavobacterium luteum]|uniref:T9SS type A sorting domain-containing protein n=1 Tax=Flavobacterium luteum TaxID=2026654 RepID=A0A7J5AH38_9FLAO|nr:T9SS type A sorting domain-containing protein [Flavobacterium luteum]KAB1156921.1 T9SS type A sorting domain-containing protein [Flavobacterium luteum]
MNDKDSQIIDLQIFKCCTADADGDGVCDSEDQCVGNNSQDANQNGIPDSCDTASTINSKPYTLANTIGVSVSGTTITKTASSTWGNAGSLNSGLTLSDGGYLTYKVKNNNGVFVGLSVADTDYNYTTIENALYTRSDNNIYVYENGTDKSGIIKAYTTTSVLKIMYQGGRVKYFCDENLIYVSSTFYTNTSLKVDFSMNHINSQIIDLQLFESCKEPIFENVGIIGNGSVTYQLPLTSSNGIAGTWNPNTLAEGEQDYTFTPNSGQCANPITISFMVLKPKTILAFDEDFTDTAINGNTGGQTPSVFTNDEINFTDVVTSTNATVALLAVTPTATLTINPDGTITIPRNTPAGTYSVDYKITSIACPLNNDSATATINVTTTSAARKAKSKAKGESTQSQLTEKITVYPNPSTAIFTIDLTGTNGEYNTIIIHNLLGQTMYQDSLVPKASNPIDLSNAPSGYYMARVSSSNESKTFQLIKK